MNTTIELLNALKAKTGAVSDYALAKKMNVTRGAVSHYQTGKRTFDDETALKVALMLDIDPLLIIASVHEERSKTDETKALWRSVFERLGGQKMLDRLSEEKSKSALKTTSSEKKTSDTMYIM